MVNNMLPYKIRKPAYNGAKKYLLPEKPAGAKRTSSAADDADKLEQLAKDDPRLIGGNLQKAILLDLLDLRERFLERENSSTSSIFDTAVASTSSNNHSKMPSVGMSFKRFKATFKERRFGAIHTRTAPRNIDRGEYAQLLYSCCFYLLEESVENDDVHNKFSIPRSIFAIFALYTLHQTNPLPLPPPTRQSTPRTKYGSFKEDALIEAWSVLPITREEQLQRRYYKSPVRIDRKNYLLLLQLSDFCKALVATYCSGTDVSPSHLGLAQDASYIIDKMLFAENFFSNCEYHGPCGLEGLAGNPHFYREHFVKQKKKPKKDKSAVNNETASLQLAQDKLDRMRSDEDLNAILNVSDLSNIISKHKANVQNITTQLQRSRQTGGDLQPRQQDLVENTLRGITSTQQAYFDMTSELNGEHTSESCQAITSNAVVNATEGRESNRSSAVPLLFPESFSSELRDNICKALADFNDVVASVRNTVKEELKARNTTKEKVLIDTSSSIVLGAQGDKRGQSLGDILAFFDVHSETSDVLEVNDENEMEDDLSMATGAGKNALETLLKMAEDKMKSDHLDDDAASSDDSIGLGNAALDDNSVATGSGMKALQNLLSQTASSSTEQPGKQPANTSKSKASSSSSGRQKRQKAKRSAKKMALEDEISVATGAGKNALSSLLEMVGNHSEESVSSHETSSKGGAMMDDNSVATGLGTKALQNLLSQTTSQKSPTRQAKRKKPPVERQKRQKTRKDSKQAQQLDEDEEESINNASTAMALSREDEVSVASTAAGTDALAALLSQVGRVEEV